VTLRLLPRSEWPAKLVGTELEATWPVLPDNAQVIVVEDGDRVLGCWSIYQQTHVEGLTLLPGAGAGVARKLLFGMMNVALAMGAATVQTAAVDQRVVELLEKANAVELPGRHFVMRIKDTGRM
jgi:hypothetical protein